MRTFFFAILFFMGAIGGSAHAQTAQLPDFTYQGHLQQNGQPSTGLFDLGFSLYDSATGGLQVGTTILEPQFPVSDGLFTVSLSFPGAFTGQQRWLQVSVNGQPLLPRQAVSTAPVAQFALDGNPGPPGATGATGAQGQQGVPGATGSAGPQGEPGPQGPQGVQGAPGSTGAQGPAGLEGPQGEQGPAGPQGETGPAGTSFADAPVDGKTYARKNNAWIEIDPTSGLPTVQAAILADNPTLYYPLDEAPGSTSFVDLGSAGINVALSGDAITLKPGWSRLYPTSDATYLRTNEGNGKAKAMGNPTGTATPSGSLSVEAIYSPQTFGSGYQPILEIGDDAPELPFLSFGVIGLQPRIVVGNGERVDLPGLNAGQAYHIAAVLDASVNEVRMYVNGRLLQVQSLFGYAGTLVAPTVHVASRAGADRPFVYSTLGHVAFYYGQALSVAQISAHAKAAGLYGH
ncbi:MAG TPA: hypothetical protein PLR28_03820 [Dokdonella sp.]|uniref:LamG-like jellyroll fold domain-containing protein n=1 Tax=Dokdonella sp. TaxID=2291710 RepID=UPI002CA1E4E5|nr:LamG-like jellyroll fold domain-containing protein [Dokdonella sp.]HOX71249.1 hypothetical protein [Dokdonella sp.]HPG93666.1 hypothetical protein [Dokdonella sp.]HPN79025.1 hypothetical protein [Dokdonella sp.]